MITASHLPSHRNGFKFFTKAGGLNKENIAEVTRVNVFPQGSFWNTTLGGSFFTARGGATGMPILSVCDAFDTFGAPPRVQMFYSTRTSPV